jgi:hypothetical protein
LSNPGPHTAVLIQPGSFDTSKHWYDKAHNATIHPLLNFFLNLNQARLIQRYCHLHPEVNPEVLEQLLTYDLRHFRWSGADLINVTSAGGRKQIVVIENNSCPSGQKSMPLQDEHQEQGGYRLLMERSFKPFVEAKRGLIPGALAVIYDKNEMENTGYASAMADAFNEPVYLATFKDGDPDPPVRFTDGIMEVRSNDGNWIAIRAAFRNDTRRPWNRIPIHTKTRIYNPTVACLAGGRNKLVASKAYDIFNTELSDAGLHIHTPETIWDVSKHQVPLWVKKLGGQAVVKVPYGNAGTGVFTIVSKHELDAFMQLSFEYDKFIVQSLIGNYKWSSRTSHGKMYHVGMVPSSKEHTYVFDIRMMLSSSPTGIRPLAVYSRRAQAPLKDRITENDDSWQLLGTNLSYLDANEDWQTDTSRLVLMDRRDFNSLGLGLDDLIEAFIQTVLSTIAIDQMADTLFTQKGRFRHKLFQSLDDDPALINEILLD